MISIALSIKNTMISMGHNVVSSSTLICMEIGNFSSNSLLFSSSVLNQALEFLSDHNNSFPLFFLNEYSGDSIKPSQSCPCIQICSQTL